MSGSYGTPRRAILIFTALIFILSGCALPVLPAGKTATPAATAQSTGQPEIPLATATPLAPTRTLTVCLGAEPNTLYPLGGPNDAAQSVLAAIDDGPIDVVNYQYQPVALTRVPSLADGDAQIVPVSVAPGSKIVDAFGTLTALAAGIRVRPSSCRSDDCVITYDGISPIKMDQLQVSFHMRSDLTWSDGTPLTADDSVYAYQLSADAGTPGADRVILDRTQTYEAVDTYTTQWWGIPGYLDSSFQRNFFAPAPKHLWGKFKAAQLPTTDIAARAPAGWGPYKMKEWVEGDHITLDKNPYYFRAQQGYPKFDQLIFRFITDPN